MREVNVAFRKHNLTKVLDYSAQGSTYDEGGTVIVEVEFYTQEARKLYDSIETIRINLDNNYENIKKCISQIEAEEQSRIIVVDEQAVMDGLQLLDTTDWTTLDAVSTTNTPEVPTLHTPLRTGKKVATKHIALKLLPNLRGGQDCKTLPLFSIIAKGFMHSINDSLARDFGCYPVEISIEPNNKSAFLRILMTKEAYKATSVEAFARSIEDEWLKMLRTVSRQNTIEALLELTKSEASLPNVGQVLSETKVLIGKKGWDHIATPTHINDILTGLALITHFKGTTLRYSSPVDVK